MESCKNVILLGVSAFALCALPGSRGAGDCVYLAYWDTTIGDWFNPLNWGPSHNQVPDCGTCCGHPWEVDINNGGTAQIGSGTAEACEMFLGKDTAQQSGKLSVSGGTLNQCGDIFVGNYGTGTLSITNGSVNTQFGAHIAAQAGSNGSATVDGTNSQWTVTAGGAGLNVAGTDASAGGTGLLTVTNGGTVTAASVHAWKSGTLTGNGTVSTTNGTTIDGTLEPNWTLTITGNLTFEGDNATMQCSVTPDNLGSIDADVSGGATLTGKVSVTMTGTFTPGTRFTLLHAAGGRINDSKFSSQSIKFPTGQGFTPKITYDANNVYLCLVPTAGVGCN